MNELNELEGLTTLGKNYTKGGNQEFDIYHDANDKKFTVSDAFYVQSAMNDNGFTAHVGNGNVYLSIQPNENSVSYKGREGFEKGRVFSSSTMSEVMEKMNLIGDLSLEFVATKNGADYYRVSQLVKENSEITQTINEELAV